jgi:TonB family protein
MACASTAVAAESEGAADAGAAPPPDALSKAPRLIHFVEATPPESLAERVRVDVVLSIDVDAEGHVSAVEVARSGGTDYDDAAVAAARQFTFEPGEAGAKKVPVRITYGYHFVLKPPPPLEPPAAAASAAAAPSAAPAGPSVPLEGHVRHKGDRVGLPGVAVLVDGGQARAVTGDDGRFSFEALPVGKHTLQLRSAQTSPADTKVELHEGKGAEVTVYLDAKERYASTVRGAKAVVETVEHTLTVEEVKRIPGTQGDTLKAVQNLPGVARSPFGVGLLSVWGSAPQDTRVYLDGVNIPTLYHFGGLRSTINSEMISGLTFVPGGYQVDHGLGLGGVIEVQSRLPRTDGVHGYAQMDLVDGSLMLEGPITKTLSFEVAARRSWLDLTLPHFTGNQFQLSPIYYDYQARLVWRPTPRDDVSVFFLGSDDKLNLLANLNNAFSLSAVSHIYYHRGIASWMHRLQNGGTLSLTSSVGYDVPFQLGVQYGSIPTSIDARSLGYSMRALAQLPVADWLRIDAGVEYEGSRFAQDHSGAAQPPTGAASGGDSASGQNQGSFGRTQSGYASDSMTVFTNHVAPFVSAPMSFFDKRLTVTPQFRLQLLDFAGYLGTPDSFSHAYVSPEPRLALRYRLTPRLSLKAAAGLYTQPPTPDQLSRVFGNPDLEPEHGMQLVAGADFDLTPTTHVETEAFYKTMRDLVVPGENPGDPALVNLGEGRSYGAEIMLRQELAHDFYGWAAYTFSRAQRKDDADQAWHRFEFDQTHILTLIAAYKLRRGWQIGARYRFVTGDPYTAVTGSYFDSNADRFMPTYGVPFGARLSAFQQLDLRVDKIWTYDTWRFSVYLDVQNVLRAANPEAVTYSFDYTIAHPISGLPLLPIAGMRADF